MVNVTNKVGYAHHRYDVFERALEYWEENAQRYVDTNIQFTFKPEASMADITIQYVSQIETCGEVDQLENTVGCAPIYSYGMADEHTLVEIREEDDDKQLLEVTKHEIGHVLGVGHGEEPMPLMAADNLYLHASPWDRPELTYFVDFSDKSGISEARLEEEIDPALQYFEGGANGNLDGATEFERVDTPSEANIIIAFHADARNEDVFTGSTLEEYYEGDIQGTFYRRFTIAIYDLDTSAMSWHIATWLAEALVRSDESSPTILDPDECDYHCRRGSWWD